MRFKWWLGFCGNPGDPGDPGDPGILDGRLWKNNIQDYSTSKISGSWIVKLSLHSTRYPDVLHHIYEGNRVNGVVSVVKAEVTDVPFLLSISNGSRMWGHGLTGVWVPVSQTKEFFKKFRKIYCDRYDKIKLGINIRPNQSCF